MKIVLVSRKYDGIVGGVEKMSIELMNAMISRGHDVHLISLDIKGAKAFYVMDEKINWHQMGIGDPDYKASFLIRLKRILKGRKIIKSISPDAIIGFQDGAYRNALSYAFGLSIPVIAAERNSPDRYQFLKSGKYKNIIFQFFRFATKITVQCPSYPLGYPAYLRPKIVVIPNPVQQTEITAAPAMGACKKLLSVGRLGYQKNYEVLIKAFAMIAKDFPDWKMEIVGDGDRKAALQGLIERESLENSILLVGETDNVTKHYSEAHLFCLPSLWEGFPNALAEAMSHGLPCVGFKECPGVNDLIINNSNGLLAENNDNPDTLAKTLASLMSNDKLRAKMGVVAQRSMEEYAPEKVFSQWENLFKSIVAS